MFEILQEEIDTELRLPKPSFKPGDQVRFKPKFRRYRDGDMLFRGMKGTVLDSSDLPNVRMNAGIDQKWWTQNVITADQRDLEAC